MKEINLTQSEPILASSNEGVLPISEMFLSIQGEGKLTGVPSFFVRVSGCNLRCTWCDTPYASWNPEHTSHSIDAIVEEVTHHGAQHVVLTGGEPMLFPAIEALAAQLQAANMHITVETAGTIFRDLHCDLMSISPKLANSTPTNDARDAEEIWMKRHEERRLNFATLQALLDRYPQRQLKFVVSRPSDLDEIDSVLAKLKGFNSCDVLLMPEGVTTKPAGEYAWIVQACMERNWRFCPRLHIQLFGNKRGT